MIEKTKFYVKKLTKMKSTKLHPLFRLAIGVVTLSTLVFTTGPLKAHEPLQGHQPPKAQPSDSESKVPPARFHHVRLNVTDPKASIEFYEKYFSAVPIKFRGFADAILTDRSYFLFNTVAKRAPENYRTALWHVGWGGVDGPGEYKWRTEKGITWDTDITTVGTQGEHVYFMYAQGPDHEIAEVFTGDPHQRYDHIHLLAEDVNAAADWYIKHLGAKGLITNAAKPEPPPADFKLSDPNANAFKYIWMTAVQVDGVTFNIHIKPEGPVFWYPGEPYTGEFEKSDGHVINHFAFSYPDIEPVYQRMKAGGVEIVKDIAWDDKFKMKSFFVRAPDKVLVEIVEADGTVVPR